MRPAASVRMPPPPPAAEGASSRWHHLPRCAPPVWQEAVRPPRAPLQPRLASAAPYSPPCPLRDRYPMGLPGSWQQSMRKARPQVTSQGQPAADDVPPRARPPSCVLVASVRERAPPRKPPQYVAPLARQPCASSPQHDRAQAAWRRLDCASLASFAMRGHCEGRDAACRLWFHPSLSRVGG